MCIHIYIFAVYDVYVTYIYTPYMTVYVMNSLPKIPYMHRIYMVLAIPTHKQ